MRVSVIIPTKNGAGRLAALLAALAEQTVPREHFEVIVVDDGCTDDTAAVVAASGVARVVSAGQPLGQGSATNFGILHASGEVIAFTHDDAVPAPDWIERGLAAVHASPSGLVAGHVELMLGDRPTVPALMDFGRGHLDQRAHVDEGYGATANLWGRRDVVQRLGGFDAGAAWHTHDREFGERVRRAGLTMVYAPDAVVRHPARDHWRELARVTYRLGLGASWLRAHGRGEVRRRAPEWRRVRYWIPWRSIWGLERLQERGHATTRRERLKLHVVQYACLQVPVVAGSLKGSWQQGRGRR